MSISSNFLLVFVLNLDFQIAQLDYGFWGSVILEWTLLDTIHIK